jgi:hypothetical protein
LGEKVIDFDSKFTEVVFFDLECYVPPEDRIKQSKSSLIYNAANPNHFILGGVFRRMFPMQGAIEPAWQVWNFSKQDEKSTLTQIYEYFNASWKIIDERNRKNHPDLILAGTGISRLDIPALYVRSKLHDIDSDENLYETYFKAKVIDLGDVGIPLFKKTRNCYPLYPKTTNDLIQELQVNSTKTSGKRVWDLYDTGDFEAIKARTTSEVEDAIEIANKLIQRCRT